VSGIERDEEPQGNHDEEWKACYARCLPDVQHQDVQNRQGLDVTQAMSHWGGESNLRPFFVSRVPPSASFALANVTMSLTMFPFEGGHNTIAEDIISRKVWAVRTKISGDLIP
jgi:hypothetical protein